MAKEKQDFEMSQGDDVTLEFTTKDRDGVVVDITALTIAWVLSDEKGSTTKFVEKATGGNGITIPVGSDGKFQVELVPDDCEDLEGSYYHEAQIIDGSSKQQVVARGTVMIAASSIQ